jgi:protein-arginine kinase activator protein McsA
VVQFDRPPTFEEIDKKVRSLEKEMKRLAKELQFEEAAAVRDQIRFLQSIELQ